MSEGDTRTSQDRINARLDALEKTVQLLAEPHLAKPELHRTKAELARKQHHRAAD